MGSSSSKHETDSQASDYWKDIVAERKQYENVIKGCTYSCNQHFNTDNLNAEMCISAGTRYKNCQDNAIVLTPCSSFSVLGVFDGHGPKGEKVSERIVSEAKMMFENHTSHVLDLLETDPKQQVKEFSDRLKHVFDSNKYKHSGSTATLAVFEENRVHLGWVGDSIAVLYTIKNKDVSFEVLTRAHDFSTKQEKDYIRSCGGRLEEEGPVIRLYNRRKTPGGPSLAMSRAVGDLAAKKCGCRSDFEYKCVDLVESSEEEVKLLIIASDGVWNALDPKDVGKFLNDNHRNTSLAKDLCLEARGEWLRHVPDIDDITCVVVRL